MSIDSKVKNVFDQAINENWADKLCRTCLLPLDEYSENVFSKIIYENEEFSIVEALRGICDIKISEDENCRICSSCLRKAITAFEFYHQIRLTENILDHCIMEIEANLNINIDTNPGETTALFLYLCTSKIGNTDQSKTNIDLTFPKEEKYIELENKTDQLDLQNRELQSLIVNDKKIKQETVVKFDGNISSEALASGNYVVVLDDDGTQHLFKMSGVDTSVKKTVEPYQMDTVKKRKQRMPMTYKQCTHCPTEYRFYSKLKHHMKLEHNVDLFVCKICNLRVEGQKEFYSHAMTHTNVYICANCNEMFKKREKIILHLQRHERSAPEITVDSRICEICGQVFADVVHLKNHCEKVHDTKFTCFYCGKRYKGCNSFEAHIKKHEMHQKQSGEKHVCEFCNETFSLRYNLEKHVWNEHGHKRRYECKLCQKRYKTISTLRGHEKTHTAARNFHCELCGRRFVDARALLWHQRLHKDERPFACEVCGKAFVSANRRNQHVMCAHTAPTRQCPLCPSLFHLRSMVNSHIRKVHLKAHKRWNRTSRHLEVNWRTEPVPLEELSIDVQNELLELKTYSENPDCL